MDPLYIAACAITKALDIAARFRGPWVADVPDDLAVAEFGVPNAPVHPAWIGPLRQALADLDAVETVDELAYVGGWDE